MAVVQNRPTTAGTGQSDPADADMLFKEAKRRERRRRFLWLGVAFIVSACVVVLIVGLTREGVPSKHPYVRPARIQKVTPIGTTAASIVPQRPSSLAVGPNGNLYIADDMRNQVLERLSDGTFVVVAGTGKIGFSGDGGPATAAELNYPAGITFGSDGTLYIADQLNGRIRAVSPAGIITTIAGNGTLLGWVEDATPALQAPLQPFAMTFGPGGPLYVATSEQVLRLDPDGTFSSVLGENANQAAGLYGIGGPAVDASADGPDGLAFDSSANMYVFGSNTKAILMVDPQGIVHDLGTLYPRGPSGLATLPDGSVVAMDELAVVGLSPQGIKTLASFPTTDKVSYLGITGFSPNGIAVGPNGSIYLDTFYGNGYADKSALIRINPEGTPSLLWERHQ
jgi:sugar lactone lactonase YvrE